MNWKKFFTEKKIEALVFDFDGTIADTEGLQMEKWNILLKPYGIEISLEEYAKKYCGKTSSKEIPRLLKKEYGNKIPLSVYELGEQAGRMIKMLFLTREIRPMLGVKKAMLFFIVFKFAVCSGRNPEELEMKLTSVGLSEFFPKNYRSTESEAGGFGKPHRAMYLLAARRLGVFPEHCVAFEDTESGVQSAAGAGMFVIAMPGVYSQGQDFSKADVVIQGGWPAFMEEIRESFSRNEGS